MQRIAVIALVVAGCKYDPRPIGEADARGGDDVDARADATPGDPCAVWTFSPDEFAICDIPVPAATTPVDLTEGDWTLDGVTGVLTDGDVTIQLAHVDLADVSVVSVDHLSIADGATLRGTGALPLAIVAWTRVDIAGTLDVSSTSNGPDHGPGAGANSPRCPTGASGPQPGTESGNGDGGAGGGGFGDAGGAGGNGDTGAGPGGAAGFSRALRVPPLIEGGCAGATATGANGTPGTGGAGGGAILVVARTTLAVSGVITAGGAGGDGATNGGRTGGGGGGSGGMIKLEGGTVTITGDATLAANGGQGGGGNDGQEAEPGEDGRADLTAAATDNHEGMGTMGGAGGVLGATVGGTAAQSTRGGGGGGGGVGYIRYRGHPTITVTTPNASPEGSVF